MHAIRTALRTFRSCQQHNAADNNRRGAAVASQVGAGDTYRMKSAANPQGAGAAAVSGQRCSQGHDCSCHTAEGIYEQPASTPASTTLPSAQLHGCTVVLLQ
jgi:hypothetical protein